MRDLIKRAFPRYWNHHFFYLILFLSNMTDYIFIQYQILNILNLFVSVGGLIQIINLGLACAIAHLAMGAGRKLETIMTKILALLVFISVILMNLGCVFDSTCFDPVSQGFSQLTQPKELFKFDRGKILQCVVLIQVSFRSDQAVLSLFQQTGKKDPKEMRRYSIYGLLLYFVFSLGFGAIYASKYHNSFDGDELNLSNGFQVYVENSIVVNCVNPFGECSPNSS